MLVWMPVSYAYFKNKMFERKMMKTMIWKNQLEGYQINVSYLFIHRNKVNFIINNDCINILQISRHRKIFRNGRDESSQ